MVHENPPHHLSGDAKELGAAFLGDSCLTHEAQEDFAHQSGRLERVASALAAQVLAREAAQLAIDERDELLERFLAALAPLDEEFGDVGLRGLLHETARPGG